jgi:NAD+ synthase (glutamine-hydrolysing)
LIKSCTSKNGGVYLYSNHQGCDGGRLYFDGSSMIWSNGQLKSQSSQFSLRDVEVINSIIDLDDISNFRMNKNSRSYQGSEETIYKKIYCDFNMTTKKKVTLTKEISPKFLKPEEEIALGP